MLRFAAAVALTSTVLACAGITRGSRCAPIDPELSADYGGLYDECTVDQRARLTSAPHIQYPGAVPTNLGCVYGVLRFIVDALGEPVAESVEVVAGNDRRYVQQMLNGIPQVRFAPGMVKKRPVHQIARWESRTPVSQLTSMRTTSTRTTSC